MQWVQDLNQSNVDNLNNVRREASRHFKNKKDEYLKAQIEEIEINSKIKNIRELYRGISDFKKGYKPRTNIVKDDNGDLFVDSHSILVMWRKYFSQLLNVQRVSEVRHIEIHTTKPLVPKPSAFGFEMDIGKLKSHKSPGIDQTSAKLIKTRGRTTCFEIQKLTNSIWNKGELSEEWKELIIVPIDTKGDKTDCRNYRGILLLPTTYKILSNILLSKFISYAEEIIGDHQCGFRRNRSTTDHILCIRQILEKNGNKRKQCINYL